MNIAQDCELFKAKKGYTRLYKIILTYKRQTRVFSLTPLSQDIPFDLDLARLFKAKNNFLFFYK